ncbi:DUF5324 family protein [Streptomyces formicae]|uniref:DUF5324 family protein n=1 Tax=Streptomyces formicae TaxID=1616117 RepID=UPI001F5AFF5F|nr:DUF5324 family protein [Streptomyces formicae]
MTRMDSVRAATGTAKDSVLHAAEVVAPYADTAMDQAAQYAHEARVRLAPHVSRAAHQARRQARVQYESLVAPYVPDAAQRAAVTTRRAARQAADYTVPRIEQAVAVAQPVGEEAVARSTAALAALRGQVSANDIQKLVRRRERRARYGRAAKGVAVFGVLAAGLFAAWRWWDKQANPDWLVEPPAPTEVRDSDTGTGTSTPLTSVDGDGQSVLDPEVRAKQENESEADREDRR